MEPILEFLILFQILQCANEGVKFLDERKDFWQMQKPVYARKAELMPETSGQKKFSAHSAITKSVLATMSAKSAINNQTETKFHHVSCNLDEI